MSKRTHTHTDDKDDLTRLREDNQRLRLAVVAEYQRGYKDGWQAAVAEWWAHMQRLNDEFFKLGSAMTYTFGVVAAGFGNTPRAMLKNLSGKIAEASDRILSETRTISRVTGERITTDGLVRETDEIKDALKAMYAGEDHSGDQLRALAARYNPMMADNILRDRLTLGPGIKKKPVLDRLCDRMKTYRDQGLTFTECYEALTTELYAIQQPDPDLTEEIEWLGEKDNPEKALTEAFRRRKKKHEIL